jgi:hypothetical protein
MPLTGVKLLSLPDGANKEHPAQEKEREMKVSRWQDNKQNLLTGPELRH